MNNMGTMAELIEAAMKKKKGDKDSFMMAGQYTSPVMYDEETSREFVIYEAPNGEEVKVYGSWNEYAVDVDDEGRDIIEDLDFPIIKNQDGDFILDVKKMEEQAAEMKAEQEQMEAPEQEMRQEEDEQEEEMGTEEKLRMMLGGKMRKEGMMMYGAKMKKDEKYAEGGKMEYAEGGKPNSADPETLKNTILAKKRELSNLKRRSAGMMSQEVEQQVKALEMEIEELRKEARLAMRRRNEAERGVVTMAGGGYLKPMKR